jgi:transporter family-2 protein
LAIDRRFQLTYDGLFSQHEISTGFERIALMSSLWPYILLAVVAGFCLPTQAGINAQLNLWSRSAILTATISFAVGTIGLAVYALILRVPLPAVDAVRHHPWWVWSGGLLGAFLVASTVVLAPRLGAASMIALIVAGQMLASICLDHFGWLGYPVHSINGFRLLGAILLVGGVALIRLF